MQGLLQLIEAERRSDTVNRLLLQHLLRMLTALGIYEDAFQARGQRASCAARLQREHAIASHEVDGRSCASVV